MPEPAVEVGNHVGLFLLCMRRWVGVLLTKWIVARARCKQPLGSIVGCWYCTSWPVVQSQPYYCDVRSFAVRNALRRGASLPLTR